MHGVHRQSGQWPSARNAGYLGDVRYPRGCAYTVQHKKQDLVYNLFSFCVHLFYYLAVFPAVALPLPLQGALGPSPSAETRGNQEDHGSLCRAASTSR